MANLDRTNRSRLRRGATGSRRLTCFLRRHQWPNGGDAEEHKTVRTCTPRAGIVNNELSFGVWAAPDPEAVDRRVGHGCR
jgi:hypothetical protein